MEQTTINGVNLSQEELLAALLIADLPAIPGFDDLESRVFGELPKAHRPMLLAAAERSLIARGLLLAADETPSLDTNTLALLAICARPERTWMLVHQPRSQPERTSYVHQATRTVVHIENSAIHQFVELSGSSDVRPLVAGLIDAANARPDAGLRGLLAEPTFAEIANTNQPGANLASRLRAGGLDEATAAAFAAALDDRTSLTACALFDHRLEPPLQQVFTVVASQVGHWAVWPADVGMLRVQQTGPVLLGELLDRLEASAAASAAD